MTTVFVQPRAILTAHNLHPWDLFNPDGAPSVFKFLAKFYGAEAVAMSGTMVGAASWAAIAFTFATDAEAVAFKLKHCNDLTFVEGGAS